MKRKKSVFWAMAFLFIGALIFNNQRSYGASDICVQSYNRDCTVVWWKCITASDGTKQCWDETIKFPDMTPYNPQQ